MVGKRAEQTRLRIILRIVYGLSLIHISFLFCSRADSALPVEFFFPGFRRLQVFECRLQFSVMLSRQDKPVNPKKHAAVCLVEFFVQFRRFNPFFPAFFRFTLCLHKPFVQISCLLYTSHRLADRKRIDIEDLYGETLMMVKRGDSGVNDFLRNNLETNHPQIQIEDTPPFYDLSVFNHCAETGKVLLTIECWNEVHPALVSLPVNWEYSIPYGLLYSPGAPADVQRFVEKVKALVNES